ncbi:unnamed protein product [Symbiodinium sp. CCMP2592]|nr:unnamed protein product [Symbiodinium sp. CCMP2592]
MSTQNESRGRFKDAIFATRHAAAHQGGALLPEKDRVLAFTFGWDETRQPHTVATAASSETQPVGPPAADDDIAIMDAQPDPKPGRGGCNAKGSAEYANSLVCSACVAWDPPCGERRANELVFPPRQINSCDAGQIFRGLISNFEDFAFDSSFDGFVQEVAKAYKYIFISAVGDSASANCKGIAQFLAYIQQLSARHNIVCTGIFTPCFAHQFSRVLLLHLEQSSVSAALYSISRLHQNSATRKSASGAMRQLLQQRFQYHENTFPPEGPTTSPAFRQHLTRLLTGIWDPDEVDDAWEILDSLIFNCGNHIFTPSRWTKVAPTLQQWARGLTIHKAIQCSYVGSDALQQDQAPEAQPAAADLDGFRASMTLRKSRAKKFLEDPTSLFSLLCTLCMNFLLDVPMRVCFKLFDADKEGLDIPNRQKEERPRKCRRLRCKGAQAFQIPQIDETKQYTLLDINSSSLRVVDYVWKALEAPLELTVLQVPAVFWPQTRGTDDMFQYMTRQLLKALAALKWRVGYKFQNAPYRLLDMVREDCSKETQSILTEKFLDMPDCCLSPFWGRPVKDDVLSSLERAGDEAVDPAVLLKNHVENFKKQTRGVTIREEHQHAMQRTFAGGWRAKARSFWQQAAQAVLANSSKNCFARRQGLVRKAKLKEWASLKRAVQKRRIIHSRPRQCGNAMFFYASTKMSQGGPKTKDELFAEWKSLPAAEKQNWKNRQQLSVIRKRQAKRAAKDREEEELEKCKDDTPWGLGCSEHALRPELLGDFLEPYRKKETGVNLLREIDHPAAVAYVAKMDSGEVKYHSRDAAVAGAKSKLGTNVEPHSAVGWDTWNHAEACPAPKPACFDTHPGLCAAKAADKRLISLVPGLVSQLPRQDAILMLEQQGVRAAERQVFFVRLVVGQVVASVHTVVAIEVSVSMGSSTSHAGRLVLNSRH